MPSKPFIRGAELRQRLKQAKKNDTITLPLREKDFGEYQGPFILDKPITLIGLGNKTPLLAKGCPAVIVLSPGVKLENLELADSFDTTSGVCLLVEDKSQPILENVKYCGRKVIMSREHLIDLGDFIPQQQASSYFEVEVAAPSRVKCAENSAKWLRINPDSLPSAGKHMLQITCDAKTLGPDAFAAGSLEILTGSESRTIWVTMHVLPVTPPKLLTGQIALLFGKDHRIRFSDGFIIGKSKFPGQPAASSIADRQAILLKEGSSGAWAIFQPWQTSTPTIVNGLPIAQGQRLLLQDGYLIRAGNLELKVETFIGLGNYSVSKSLVDLGSPGAPPVDTGFQLHYQGGGKDKARIVTTVPWLQVSPTDIEFKKDEIKDVVVSLTPAVANLPPIKHSERSAILIQSKNETLSLDARIEVKAQTIIPRAMPDNIKLGVITDWTMTHATLAIFNDGTKEWRPTVKADWEWLTIEPPGLVVPPGKSVNLSLRPNQNIGKLVSPSDQTAIVTLEGDGVILTLSVSARLQLQEAKPILETPTLDFKELDDWDRASPSTIIIRNKGTKDWQAGVQKTVNWLDIPSEKSIYIAAGGQKTILVQVNSNLPVGDHNIPDAVLIEGDGKRLSIAAKVKLKPPSSIIEIFPRQVDFGKFEDWKSAVAQQVTFRNRGTAEWSGTIRCSLPWLERLPSRNEWKCAAKSEVVLSLRVNDQIVEGQYSVPDAITFEGPGGPYRLPVKAHFEPKPRVRSIPVDFGEVAGWESAPSVTLPVYNDGNKDWSNVQTSSSVPWIHITPQKLTVPKNGKAELLLQLNERLNELPSGQHEKPDAILLSGDGITLQIGVKLVLPPIELQASESEITFNIDEDTELSSVQRKLIVSNVGRRDWVGKIEARVPWLKIEPDHAMVGVKGTLSVMIGVTDAIRGLGTGEQYFGSLIAFENSSLAFDVRVKIKKPPVISDELECEPSPLDFGKIEEGTKISTTSQVLTIYCECDWQATVAIQDNWFKPTQDTINGIAGKYAQLKIELTEQAARLSEGVHWSELRITTQSGRSHTIPVKIEKVEVPPDLIITPPILEFAWHVTEGRLSPQKFRVENRNKKEWKISVDVAESWLSVAPVMGIICPALGDVEFEAGLADMADTLKDGRYTQELSLRVGSKYRFPYPVNLVVDRSVFDWDIYPEGIAFGSMVKNSTWDERSLEELTVRNKGNQDIYLTVTLKKGAQWLDVPGSLRVPSRSDRKLKVGLKRGAWNNLRLGSQEGLIEISGAGKPLPLIVTLQLVSDREKSPLIIPERISLQPLEIEIQQLVFDEIDPKKWQNVPGQRIRVTNPNETEWSGKVICADWLTVQPGVLNLIPRGSEVLVVKLKPSLFGKPIEPQPIDAEDAIMIRRGNELYKVRVIVGKSDELHAPTVATPAEVVPPQKIIQPKKTTVFDRESSGRTETPSSPTGPSESRLVRGGLFSKRPLGTPTEPVTSPTTIIDVQPLQLDFGQVTDWTGVAPKTVTIRNQSDQPIEIGIISSVPWLKAAPAEIACSANGQESFQVSLFKPRGAFAQSQKGRLWNPRGVVIEVGEYSFPIAVFVETI